MCKSLREALDKLNIKHTFADCNKDPGNCDALESLTGTSMYPMVLIMDLEGNILEIAYIATEYEQLQKIVRTQNGIRLVVYHSIDGLFNYALNKLNLNT